MKNNSNALYSEFVQFTRKITNISYANAVLGWDQQTYMPTAGASIRGEQMATLQAVAHDLFVSEHYGDLLKKLSEDGSLDPAQAVNVQKTLKDYERKKKYSSAFVENFAKLSSDAFTAWHEARAKNDFKIFQPLLEKIVELKKQEAEFLGYEKDSYEALLEDYEPGLSVEKIDEVFGDVKEKLFPLIKKIAQAKRPRADFISREYPLHIQSEFANEMAVKMGYSFESGRSDVAAHPFCTTLGPGDVRITQRGDANYFNMLFFSVVHEAGHALYELGLPMNEHYGMPMAQATSMGFHESQSRFWENTVARSEAYWAGHFGDLQQRFSDSLGDVSSEEFYRAVNLVEPSLIRVEADELTYHAHIYIRYVCERAMLSGNLQVKDLPGFWNDRYEEYLGIRPDSDANGCLQDVHWSHGAFGYFPTYSFGSFYGAQFGAQMRKELPNFDQLVQSGEFKPILNWLREKFHVHGRRYSSNELLKQVTGEELSFQYFMNYANDKFGKLYDVS